MLPREAGRSVLKNLVELFSMVLGIGERTQGGEREEDGYSNRTNWQLLGKSLELLIHAKGTIMQTDTHIELADQQSAIAAHPAPPCVNAPVGPQGGATSQNVIDRFETR